MLLASGLHSSKRASNDRVRTGLFFMLAAIIFTAHFLACMWYAIGTAETPQVLGHFRSSAIPDGEDPGTDPVETIGWVNYEPWAESDGTGYAVSDSTRYWMSMYQVLNALDGWAYTDLERKAAVFATIMTIMIDGAVAGVMSALLIGMSGNEREVNDKLRAIKTCKPPRYCCDLGRILLKMAAISLLTGMAKHRIPRMKQNRALNYFASHYKNQIKHADILMDMPPAMRDDIATHLYVKVIAAVPIFRDLSKEILRSLCENCQPMIAVKGQVIFEEGSTGAEMCKRASPRSCACADCR